ncbi:MAG: hypothetical protein MI864_17770 [Pseudomonadales bacterium]|nr:hypothetical protein [Pseudomonadales bacterium]
MSKFTSYPATIRFRAKPSDGTPNYASLHVNLFTSETGGHTADSYGLILSGDSRGFFKIVRSGYKGEYYSGNGKGLLIGPHEADNYNQAWREIEIGFEDGRVQVLRDNEPMLDLALPDLPNQPTGHFVTLRAESGNWDFDWLELNESTVGEHNDDQSGDNTGSPDDNTPIADRESFDDLSNWSGGTHLVSDGVLTLTPGNGDTLTTLNTKFSSFPAALKFRAKPADGTPNYASLHVNLFTHSDGSINQDTYSLIMSGDSNGFFKIVRSGYIGEYYSGSGKGLLIGSHETETFDQSWREIEIRFVDGHVLVFRDNELMLDLELSNLPTVPAGQHITFRAESGNWDFDWIEFVGCDSHSTHNTPPSSPTELFSDAVTTEAIRLNWTPSQDDEAVAGYRVYRDEIQVADIPATDSDQPQQWMDNQLTPDTTYRYSISAYDNNNATSSLSDVLTVKTLSEVLGPIIIGQIEDQIAAPGSNYEYHPQLHENTSDSSVRWFKEYGPDELTVEKHTGIVKWEIASDLPSESFHLGVKVIDNAGNEDLETWILTVGDAPNIVYAGPNETYKTVADGVRALQSGDTLIIRNGTYIGDDSDFINRNSGGALPPSGTPTAFTTVIAEDPGQVIFDGRGVNTSLFSVAGSWDNPDWPAYPIASTPRDYIAFKGIHVHDVLGTGVYLSNVQYVKLIDIGVSDSGRTADCKLDGSGTHGNCGYVNLYVRRSNHVLIEDSYTYGHARYQIAFRKSKNGIVRRAVSRIDGYIGREPVGAFQTYCSQDIVWQNAIVVDSNSDHFWVRHTYAGSAFGFAASDCQSYDASGSLYDSGIALNNSISFSGMNHDRNDSYNFVKNSIGWGGKITRLLYGNGGTPNIIGAYGPIETDQLTLGRIDAEPQDNYFYFYHYKNPLRISNSIIFQLGWDNGVLQQRGRLAGSSSELSFNYVNLFENGITERSLGPREYVGKVYFNNEIEGDPRQMGLQYLPQISSGSVLATAGENGKRVGAHIMNRLGRSGAFHGQPDWNTLTNYALWPYPHESLIKRKMANYSYTGPTRSYQEGSVGPLDTLSGARGFAAQGEGLYGGPITLTSYIWEQLGYPCPDTICFSVTE